MAGARGYVDALSNTEILSQVAKTVNEGALWLPAPLVTSVIGIISSLLEKRQTQPADLSNLTEREREVTEAVVAGASNKEVAKQLQITERTVKAHLSNIFDKLGVRDRMHLMLAVRGKSS
ncbi:response regulator transcription factor [Nitrincola tapanii]|uniref:Response regulator transcription factor n=2 Tax=Nitrincola tapanii TaxID=1708751 RepID=A0A5A9W537_9GAMM|nr:response regulator transcription factor [Nitrincola tapanii]